MAKVIKYETDIENIYTYYEFDGYDGWEQFDELLSILIHQIQCNVIEKLEGIYSKHCLLENNDYIFKLMYHEDFGNCLCSQEKKDNNYYNKLGKIAEEVNAILNDSK